MNTNVGDTDVKPGFQALAGVRFFLTRHIALFGEYKFLFTDDFTFNLISQPGTVGGAGSAFQISKREFNFRTPDMGARIYATSDAQKRASGLSRLGDSTALRIS